MNGSICFEIENNIDVSNSSNNVGMSFDVGYASWENYSGKVMGFSSTLTGDMLFLFNNFNNFRLQTFKSI